MVSTQPRRDNRLDTPDPRAHRAEIDALRGIAIIGVVLCHITASWTLAGGEPLILPLLGADLLELMRYGSFGVSLFFLLSGYLLGGTEGKRAKRGGGYSLRSYTARRALRLVPAYYFSIVIICLLWPAEVSGVSVANVLWHASFLHALSPEAVFTLDGVYWSLTAEVAFYLLLPFFVLKLPGTGARVGLLISLALLSLGTRVYMTLAGFDAPDYYPTDPAFWYLYFLPTTHFYLFIAGMLLGTMAGRMRAGRSRRRFALVLFASSAVGFVVFPYAARGYGEVLQSPLAMLVDLLVAAFFASALLGAPVLRGILAWRPLVRVGTVSYSLFLLHNTVLVLLTGHYLGYFIIMLAPWLAFFAYACLIFAVAGVFSYLSYRYVESPFLRYKPR